MRPCDSLLCPIQRRPPHGLKGKQLERWAEVPVVKRSKQLKTAALAVMRDVYEKASYVLVLDRALEVIPASRMTPLEATVRLLTTRWMQRLWTYQEAALPQKLLF